jgi:dihydrofolate reductase
MCKISIIVALADNNAIGKNQQLLWHMPYDMKRFKTLTTGHAVIMGRKTFESLPKGALPNRKNVVLTSMPNAGFVNCFACDSMRDALDICEKEEEIFMIGGSTVYKQALKIADKMYLTRIHHVFEDADTFFPEFDINEWEEVERQEFSADEKHKYPYTFLTYERKKTEGTPQTFDK